MLFLLPSLKLCIVGYICILWFLPGNSIYSAYCLIHASKNILTVFSRLDRPWLPLNLFFAVFLLFYPSLFLTQTPSPWLPPPPSSVLSFSPDPSYLSLLLSDSFSHRLPSVLASFPRVILLFLSEVSLSHLLLPLLAPSGGLEDPEAAILFLLPVSRIRASSPVC